MKQEELSKMIIDHFVGYDDKDDDDFSYSPERKVSVEFSQKTSFLGKKTDVCMVHLSKMYHGLGDWASYANLKWLAELLGTDEIDLKGEYYREGCDTCDYGSVHSVTIECRNIKLK